MSVLGGQCEKDKDNGLPSPPTERSRLPGPLTKHVVTPRYTHNLLRTDIYSEFQIIGTSLRSKKIMKAS